jgi:sarcosine oxidase
VSWLDHAVFIVLAVVLPLRAGAFSLKRLHKAPLEDRPRVRLAVYRQAMLIQWSLVATVAILWLAGGRPWRALGVVTTVTPFFVGLAVALAAGVAVVAVQRRRALADDEALAKARERLSHVEVMLPHDAREARWFYGLSFTAGVCEEVLYRGYMIWYLAHGLGLWPAAGVASLIFGIGHSYQGWRGVLATTCVGAAFAGMYLTSGSLLLPAIAHVLVDVHAGHLAHRAYARQREQMIEQAKTARGSLVAGTAAALAGLTAAGDRPADVIVVGLGAIGSATVDRLARRGLRVIGLDRFRPPHDRGSSHGETRLIREAYFEGPIYVPLVQRAYELWRELEREQERKLLTLTGGLMIGPPEGPLVSGAILSAETHGLPFERLDAAAIRARFPGFEPADSMVGVWEPRTGYLFPEACIEAQLARARGNGADIRLEEPVLSWAASDAGVSVETGRGRHHAAKLVICPGSWIAPMLGDLSLPFTVTRQPLFWFEPRADRRSDPARYPSCIWEHEPSRFFYAFPELAGEVKAAFHILGERLSPGEEPGGIAPGEPEALARVLERHMPDVPGRFSRGVVCRYTNLPDTHFLVDFHPAHANVLVASVCSGHGFKFAPAIGEVAADLLEKGTTGFDLEPFRLARFTPAVAGQGADSSPPISANRRPA